MSWSERTESTDNTKSSTGTERTELRDVAALSPVRLPLVVVGGVVLALGVGILVQPSLARFIPIEAALLVLGNEYVLVAAFGVVAILGGLAVLLGRGVAGIDQTTPPDPEEVHPVPRSGESFDEFVSAGWLREWLLSDRHHRIRTRLRESAIDTVMRQDDCTREEARKRVDRGTWTEDAEVATFLADSGVPLQPAGALAALRGHSPYQRAARRTAEEIARYGEWEES